MVGRLSDPEAHPVKPPPRGLLSTDSVMQELSGLDKTDILETAETSHPAVKAGCARPNPHRRKYQWVHVKPDCGLASTKTRGFGLPLQKVPESVRS